MEWFMLLRLLLVLLSLPKLHGDIDTDCLYKIGLHGTVVCGNNYSFNEKIESEFNKLSDKNETKVKGPKAVNICELRGWREQQFSPILESKDTNTNGRKRRCSDDIAGAKFHHISIVKDAEAFKIPFTGDSAKNTVICKAFLDGREYLGFGTLKNKYYGKCELQTGSHVSVIETDFYVLLKPEKGVRWIWKNNNGTLAGLEESVIVMGDRVKGFTALGMSFFDVYDSLRDREDKDFGDCAFLQGRDDGGKRVQKIVKGFVSGSNPGKMRFHYGAVYFATDEFVVLTCTESQIV